MQHQEVKYTKNGALCVLYTNYVCRLYVFLKAVGSLVGQLARIHGVKTIIGSCGGKAKGNTIKEKFGYDYAIDYKTVKVGGNSMRRFRRIIIFQAKGSYKQYVSFVSVR